MQPENGTGLFEFRAARLVTWLCQPWTTSSPPPADTCRLVTSLLCPPSALPLRVPGKPLLLRVIPTPRPGLGPLDPEQTVVSPAAQPHSFAASIATRSPSFFRVFPSLAVGAPGLAKKHSQCLAPNCPCPLEVTEGGGRVSLPQNRMVRPSTAAKKALRTG